MARARSPDSIKAEQMFRCGEKLIDIAKKLGVPAGTVRRWKSTQNWEAGSKKKHNERSESKPVKKANVRKPGAPPGNKNAEGAGAPERNKNAEKHGAYSKIYWDMLDETEMELLDAIPTGEEFQLKQQIAMYTIRERRMLHQIDEFKNNSKKGLYIKSIKKKKRIVNDGENEKSEAYEDTSTDTENTLKSIATLESELTKIQRAKTKCLDSLIHLKAVNERNDDLLNGWNSKRAAAEPENEEDKEEVVIYLPDNGRG